MFSAGAGTPSSRFTADATVTPSAAPPIRSSGRWAATYIRTNGTTIARTMAAICLKGSETIECHVEAVPLHAADRARRAHPGVPGRAPQAYKRSQLPRSGSGEERKQSRSCMWVRSETDGQSVPRTAPKYLRVSKGHPSRRPPTRPARWRGRSLRRRRERPQGSSSNSSRLFFRTSPCAPPIDTRRSHRPCRVAFLV